MHENGFSSLQFIFVVQTTAGDWLQQIIDDDDRPLIILGFCANTQKNQNSLHHHLQSFANIFLRDLKRSKKKRTETVKNNVHNHSQEITTFNERDIKRAH